MSENSTLYYTLKYLLSDGIHKKGEQLVAANDVVYIGQQEDCKVHFINKTVYEDELYAIIKPGKNEDEWQLVPTSQHVRTYVNGHPISLVHYLADNDKITFEGESQILGFYIHSDGKYAAGTGVQAIAAPMPKWLITILIAIPLVLFGLLAVFMYHEKQAENRRTLLLNAQMKSVFQLDVDSVYYVMQVKGEPMHVLREYSYVSEEGYAKSGTAFLTSNSQIITARHCIEPWLNDAQAIEGVAFDCLKSIPTKWAIEAETYNQLYGGDTLYEVVAVCQFYCGENGTVPLGLSLRSDEFNYRKDRDYIKEIGDFTHEYYWRSIAETYSNKAMVLDDIAWCKCNTSMKDGLNLAKEDELETLLADRAELVFVGYPDYKTKGREIQNGAVKLTFKRGDIIVHDGNLTHGYSGGPVLVIKNEKVYVVGVISRIDGSEGERSYSVPVSELKKEGESYE